MSATEIVVVGRVLPRIAAVIAQPPSSVSVTWVEGGRKGKTDIVDLAPLIFGNKLYKPLRDNVDLFKSVVVSGYGSTLMWGKDEEIDVSASAIEDLLQEVMDAEEFRSFLKRNSLTLDAAAAQLGLSRRLVAYYAQGRTIPRTVALACRYVDMISRPKEAKPRTVKRSFYRMRREIVQNAKVEYGRQPPSEFDLLFFHPQPKPKITNQMEEEFSFEEEMSYGRSHH